MKKQTFEILPVSPEERKHLIGLSYNEIGDVLQAQDSLSLISYLNSNFGRIDGFYQHHQDLSATVV